MLIYLRDAAWIGFESMKQNRTDNDGSRDGSHPLSKCWICMPADLKPFDVSLGVYNLFDKPMQPI